MTFHIREITTDDDAYEQVWELRETVLRRPLGLSLRDEDLNSEKHERIFIAEGENRTVAACVMLRPLERGIFKLRQMAVAPGVQRSGVGKALVQWAEQAMWKSGAARIEMAAREAVLPFYEKLGYSAEGETFTEVGIPHRLMKKERPA